MNQFTNLVLQWHHELSNHIVFAVGILLLGGYFLGSLAERLKLPSITGFIIAGLLLGPSCLGFVHHDLDKQLASITEIALSVIALVIGSEFKLSKLRKLGSRIIVITLFQLFATSILVTFALVLAGMSFPVAALLGAIASATAPAATVAIIRSLKARGKFVDYLYGVVALDDAGCIILFGIVAAFAGAHLGGESHFSAAILHSILEIIKVIMAGIVTGLAIHLFVNRLKRKNAVMLVSLGLVMLLCGTAIVFEFSMLLSCMTAGALMVNLSSKNLKVINSLNSLSPPLYAAFFAIAGTELNLGVLTSERVLLLGTIFVFARAVGKYGGVYFGAAVSHSEPLIKNYLGLCMLPQAGVAIGLVLYIQNSGIIPDINMSNMIMNIVLFSVLFNELTGPPLSKFAVIRGAKL